MVARTTRPHGPLPSSRGRPRNGRRNRFTFWSRIDRSAGRNVSDPTTEMNTTEIVPIAIERKSGSSSRNRPPIEIITASPEKNTARPAVLEAVEMAGQLVAPSPLRPEARDHEQRVVDRDGQADQHDELARVRADGRDELAVQGEDPERGEQRRDGQDQGHEGRHRRPEREQQDREGQRDRDPQRGVEVVVDERLDVVVGERCRSGRGSAGRDGRRGARQGTPAPARVAPPRPRARRGSDATTRTVVRSGETRPASGGAWSGSMTWSKVGHDRAADRGRERRGASHDVGHGRGVRLVVDRARPG